MEAGSHRPELGSDPARQVGGGGRDREAQQGHRREEDFFHEFELAQPEFFGRKLGDSFC